jgi:hypothetical protein
LLDGSSSLLEWAQLQALRSNTWFTWPILTLACLGLAAGAFHAARRRNPNPDPARELNLEPALLAGGVLYLFAFFRHTLDPQFPFLMLLVPGIAGLVAHALERAADWGLKGRSTLRPLAIATCALAVLCVQHANRLRYEFRAGAGEERADRAAPALGLPDVVGAEFAQLVPAGGFGVYPAVLGLSQTAVSFYAWRSLWPASAPHDPVPAVVAQHFGLADRPHVLLLPKHPWPDIAAAVEAFERDLLGGAPPQAESEHWRAWTLH